MSDTPKVLGYRRELSDGRLVFVGFGRDASVENAFLGFRNSSGQDTKLVLSREAYAALKDLINGQHGIGPADFPHKTEWRVVSMDEIEAKDSTA